MRKIKKGKEIVCRLCEKVAFVATREIQLGDSIRTENIRQVDGHIPEIGDAIQCCWCKKGMDIFDICMWE